MSGFGALDMMNKSFKNNRALLGKKKSIKELYAEVDLIRKSQLTIDCEPSPPEIIKALRKKMKRERRIRIFKLSLLLSVITVVISVLAFDYIF